MGEKKGHANLKVALFSSGLHSTANDGPALKTTFAFEFPEENTRASRQSKVLKLLKFDFLHQTSGVDLENV